jgi:hypothetical protein
MHKAKFEGFDPQDKRVLTLDEFGYRYGMGRTSTYRLIRAGQLETVRIGRRHLVPVEAAEKLLNPIK